MTRAQAQILELFQSLPDAERRDLAVQLYEQTVRGTFFEQMTAAERAELDASILEADRGEGEPLDDALASMRAKHGFKRGA
jgi:hypothetical protein